MALDYSKLSTAELEAIANDDFSKLSNRTLRLISNEPEPKSIKGNIKDFGKATASLADTGINAITGMLDYAAYPLARAFGRSPEQATQETTSPKDVIGRGLGITQDPAYQSEASRRLMAGFGQGIENYAVKPLVSATGLPEQDVSSMVGSAMLGAGVKAQPYINRAGQTVAQGMYAAEPYITGALKAPVKAPVQFGKGLVEGLVNKEYNPATSAMVPLRDTYTPPAAAERFMGQLPGVPQQSLSQLQSQARPTSELVGGTAGRVAQAISPKTLAGETLVPLQGQTMKAFGERVGRGVRTNPLQAMGEVGLTALTGIPFKTLAQGVGELGARYLGAKTGFMPGFSQQVGQAQGRAGIQSQMPQTPLLTNNPSSPGPVNPSTMFVSPEGVAGTNINQVSQAGAQQKYAPQPVPQTPQQMAVQKTQEIVNQQAPKALSPGAQAIMDQIRARGSNQLGQMKSTPPTQGPFAQVETPVAGPIAPTAIQSLSNQRWTPAEKLALERANLQNNPPPAMTAADEAAMVKQLSGKELEGATKQNALDIIKDYMAGGKSGTGELAINEMNQTRSIDLGAIADNKDNVLLGMAKGVVKAGYDSVPEISGMSHEQVIRMMYGELTGKKAGPKTKGYEPGTTQTSTSSLQEALNKVKSNKVKTKTIDDAQTDLSTNDLKSIFKTETGLDLDIDKIKEGIFGKHRMEFPPNSNDLLKQKTAKEIKDAAKIYKEAYDGKMLFENAFAARNQSIPSYWQLRDVLGKDLSYGNKAFNDLAKMSPAEVQARVDAYIQKNPDKTFNKTELMNDTTLENVDYVKPPPKTLEEKVDVVKTQGEARRNQARGKPNVLEMKIDDTPAGGSILDQSIVAKRSFNQDMQKYRYGSSKDPLTVEEYNHLQNSDFIEKQNMFDILKEIDPVYTEHNFWYKDKDGTVINVEPYKGQLTITKIDKKNPEKETTYSKDNPDREDVWVFYKIEHNGGNKKIIENFEVKDTFSPRDPRLKNWPAEFTNSKYDME